MVVSTRLAQRYALFRNSGIFFLSGSSKPIQYWKGLLGLEMNCDLCKRNQSLGAEPLCEVCCEAITRVAGAQLRIDILRALEVSKATKRPKRIDVDDYRSAYPGLKPKEST